LLKKLTKVRRTLAGGSTKKFIKHLKDFKPDVVLCPHFLPLEIVGGLKAKDPKFKPLTVCVVTDFEAHALWMEPGVDLYCVATQETKARLVARGAVEKDVIATGIPVAAKFSSAPDKKAVRKQYGLRDDLPTVLVLSGGFGMGPVAEILGELDKLARPLQTLVVAGRNEKLKRELASKDRKHPTHVLGFVTNMQEFMAVADLIITKPGGLTTSEALAMGRPLFILNPIPGQEAANSDFLLQHGAAEKANCVEDLPFRLEQLLGSKKLGAMAKAAKGLGRPGAAAEICREVTRRVEGRG
jgi:processive 1,2-diacylglycerol beta-glucosyltransferase